MRFKAWSSFFLFGLSISAAWAQSNVEAYLLPTGEVRFRRDGSHIGSLRFAMFLKNWQWVTFTPEGGSGNQVVSRGVWDGGSAVATTTITEVGGHLQVHISATTTAPVEVEQIFAMVSLPAASWAGGLARFGDVNVPMPLINRNPDMFSGVEPLADFVRSERLSLRVSFGSPQAVLFQDLRQYGNNFDLRFGDDGTRLWLPSSPKQFSATVTFNTPIEIRPLAPVTIQEGPDWVPYVEYRDVQKGSALDFSPAQAQPAGSRGWVQPHQGHLAFETAPSVPVRFFGINVYDWTCFLEPAWADRLADRLQAMGYNCARLFGEYLLSKPGQKSTVIDPVLLDRLNYTVAALKARGIYIAINLYSYRIPRPDEIIPGALNHDDVKALLLFHSGARQNWLEFAANLLESHNPYTGLKWKDDPAIAFINLVNEGGLENAWSGMSPHVRAMLQADYQARGYPGQFELGSLHAARYETERQIDTYLWMRSQLRAMGVRAVIMSVNGTMGNSVSATFRDHAEVLVDHAYHNHPVWLGTPFVPPLSMLEGGTSLTESFGGKFKKLALARDPDKPLLVTEFSSAAPSILRAEQGLVLGTLASVQRWDALFRFSWSHSANGVRYPTPMNPFDVQYDPIMQAADRLMVNLYLREDLVSDLEPLVWRLSRSESVFHPIWSELQYAALTRPIGTSFVRGSTTGTLPPEVDVLESPNGVIKLAPETHGIRVATDRTCALTALPGETAQAGALKATVQGSRAVVAATSLDGRPLRLSQRILVIHATDAQNSGAVFSGPDYSILSEGGNLPVLVRDGQAQIELSVFPRASAQRVAVYRLDSAGRRIAQVPMMQSGRIISFTASVRGPEGATLYYEILR